MAQINERDTTDEIIQETRRVKEDLARSMDFDIDRILDRSRREEKKTGRVILPRPVREAV